MIFYGIEIADGTRAQNFVLEGGTTLPTTRLFGGRLFFKSDTKKLELYDGTQWVEVVSGAIAGYVLPTASASVLGGVKVGSGLTISSGILSNNGVLSFNARTGNVTLTTADVSAVLPTASSTVKGGIKVGSGLSISSGVLSVIPPAPYVLPVASPTTLGGIKVGPGLALAGDVLYASGYTLLQSDNGYQIFPDGFIIQWGGGGTITGDQEWVFFPIPFPNHVASIVVSEGNADGWDSESPPNTTVFGTSRRTNSYFALSVVRISGNATSTTHAPGISYNWIAVGW